MSGPEVLAHFRQHYPAVRVIVVTGSMNEKIAHQARAGGALSIVGKPLNLETLSSVVASAIGNVSGG
jgi:DNA-binding NtrC family response regulator